MNYGRRSRKSEARGVSAKDDQSEAVSSQPAPPGVRRGVGELPNSSELEPEKEEMLRLVYARMEERISYGPIPTPEILREYNEILPGLADRIMRMAENQAAHRQGLEGKMTTHNASRETGAHRSTTAILLTAVLCGTGLIATGHSVEGLVALISVVGGVVGTSLTVKRNRGKELARKDAETQ